MRLQTTVKRRFPPGVSGEYAMVKAGAKLGCVDEEKIVCEMATGVYRAGACVYLTYFAKEIAGYIEKKLY